jgi:hypothetical protein
MLFMWSGPSEEQKGYSHAMHRIPPSQKIRNRIEELLDQRLEREADVTSLIVRLAMNEWFRR